MRKPVLKNVGEATEEVGGFAPGVIKQIVSDAVLEGRIPHAVGADVPHSESNEAVFVDETPDDETESDLEATGTNMSEAEQKRYAAKQLRQLMAAVKEFGTLHGGGKTSMIALAEKVTEAAAMGVIDASNAEEIYDKFRAAADAKAQLPEAGVVPDAAALDRAPVQSSDQSRKSQLSKLKAFINLGVKYPKEAVDLMRVARNVHIELLNGDRESLRAGSTYTIMTSIAQQHAARAQRAGVMSEQDIRDYLYKEPPAQVGPKDGPGKLLDALIAAKAAKKGGKDRDPIENEHLDAAIDELAAALGDVARDRLDAHLAEEEQAEADRIAKEDEKAEKARLRAEKKALKNAA